MLVPEVIVFRPEPKSSMLVNSLSTYRISALAVAPFSIKFIPFHVPNIAYSDIVFTSSYAVDAFFSIAHSDLFILCNVDIWAVGSATATALQAHGIKASFPVKADSEHLLQMIMQEDKPLKDRHFLLFKGIGGRELLTQVLQQQAASLSVVDCYERQLYAQEYLLQQLQQIDWHMSYPKILLYTSFDALKATMPIFDVFSDWQQNCTVTVTNRRMLDWAKRQGFAKLYLLENLTHDQLVTQIIKLR